jgi:heptosyltransferase-3
MRILFIKLRHIGDSLLLTPTIVATKAKFPDAEIWVLVRKSCDAILAGCPEIDRILTTANPDAAKRNHSDWIADIKLAALLRRTDFDFVFELTDNDRARFFAIAARTKERCTNKHRSLRWFWRPFFHRICKTKRHSKHQVERDYICPQEVLQLPATPPALRFAAERMIPWDSAPSKYAVVHLHTRWARKSWPIERWTELLREVLHFVPHIVLSCGPGREEVAEARALCDKLGPQMISTAGRASWSQLASLLHKAAFFVGVDTAAMHLAAATGRPTVCLFGPSPAFEYHPWKVKNWLLRPQEWLGEEATKKIPINNLMNEIPVDRVLAACRAAWEFSHNHSQQDLPELKNTPA